MVNNKKKVRLYTYDGLQVGRRVYWSDTWVKVHTGKGRLLKLGPTFISVSDFVEDYEMDKTILEKHRAKFPDAPVDPYYASAEELSTLIRSGAPWDYFVIESSDSPGCPHLFINKPILGREDIEQAVWWYLTVHRGVKKGAIPKFAWNRVRRGAFIIPYSPAMGGLEGVGAE